MNFVVVLKFKLPIISAIRFLAGKIDEVLVTRLNRYNCFSIPLVLEIQC